MTEVDFIEYLEHTKGLRDVFGTHVPFQSTISISYIGNIKGFGNVFGTYAPFPEQIFPQKIQALNAVRINAPVSIRDASYIRLHGEHKRSTNTCHAAIYVKDSPSIIARMSPLFGNLEMAQQAYKAHCYNKYPVFGNDKSIYAQWEKIAQEDKRKKPEERRAIVFTKREDFKIHRDSDEARFFWQDTRKDYFKEYVLEDKVSCLQIPVEDVDSVRNGTIVKYITFGGSSKGFAQSSAIISNRIFEDNWAIGVLDESKKASEKIFGPYDVVTPSFPFSQMDSPHSRQRYQLYGF